MGIFVFVSIKGACPIYTFVDIFEAVAVLRDANSNNVD